MSDQLDAVLQLARAQMTLVKRFDSALGALHGVSLSDFTVLLRLSQAPGGRMRRVDLAEALGLTASGVTRGLVPLERIGLVTREASARDARVAYTTLTDTGRERLTYMLATAEQIAAEIFPVPPWSSEDIGQLSVQLARLGGGALPGHGTAPR